MEEGSPSVAKAIPPVGSDYVRAEARTFQGWHSVVSGVVVDRVRSYFCSPARDGDRADQAVPYSPVPYSPQFRPIFPVLLFPQENRVGF